MKMWTVYNTETLDFPGHYVARLFGDMGLPTDVFFSSIDLDEVRTWVVNEAAKTGNAVPYQMARHQNDDPNIIEVWL